MAGEGAVGLFGQKSWRGGRRKWRFWSGRGGFGFVWWVCFSPVGLFWAGPWSVVGCQLLGRRGRKKSRSKRVGTRFSVNLVRNWGCGGAGQGSAKKSESFPSPFRVLFGSRMGPLGGKARPWRRKASPDAYRRKKEAAKGRIGEWENGRERRRRRGLKGET